MIDDQFSSWVSLWDKARNTKDFQDELPAKSQAEEDFAPSSAQDDYWNYLSSNDPELLQESNPVGLSTLGKDQDHPRPEWVREDLLSEIEEMKNKLYKLEVRLNKKDAGGGKWVEKPVRPDDKALLKDLSEMRKRIDSLSNFLGQ